ncbi:MAG TPA: hypothetical protein VMB21_02345, partial [Candidatus Limnocylindria bacterium]|nr:hypothetical protein [Candidatus Limnocylindria bacterium]
MHCRTATLTAAALLLASQYAAHAWAAPSGTYADWKIQVWGAERAATAVADALADPDGDGLPNFLEYALGLDPTRPDAGGALGVHRQSDNAGDRIVFSFDAANAAREAAVQVRWSRDTGSANWLAADGQHLTDVVASTGAGAARHEGSLALVAGEPGLFAQLSADSVPAQPKVKGYVWFEAEPPNGEAGPLLSGGQMSWVAPAGSIQKTVTIPADGTYTLWVRKFWNGQTFHWRVGPTDPWKDTANPPLQDLVDLGPGRKVGWINAGSVTLTAGSKVFRLEVTDASSTTAYDCFLLTREAFTPRGKLKPDDKLVADETGWTSFQPEVDPFDFSPIDLRRLNEKQAGDGGFIATRGEEFIHSKTGEPVKFWAVNTGGGTADLSKAEVDLFARSLAKRGVNLVRIHGPVYAGSGAAFGQVDTNHVAKLHYLIAALKREGIYTSLSIYFPLWVKLDAVNTDFPGYTGKNPFALLYFNEKFQALYRTWWDYVMNTVNPNTGLALKDDPAVAMAELVNEDSLLFWTFNPDAGNTGAIPDPQRAILEKQFGDWLLKKYPGKTLDQIRTAWGGTTSPQDNFAAGRVGFRGLYQVFTERRKRDQDDAQFLAETQQKFYRDHYAYLKKTLGFRGLVYASNWQTASAQYLGPLDKLSNADADFMDRHGYFGGVHTGDASGYAIQAGQKYDDRTALKFLKDTGTGEDFNNPLFDVIYDGQPSTITEVNWPPPNRFRADYPVLAAAYGALQGSDAIFHFAAGSPAWESVPSKFSVQTPVVEGQFPAAALIYRQGLIKTAPRIVNVQLAVTDLYALKGTPLPAPQNFDQLRGNDIPPGATLTNVSAIDSLAFLVGRVGVDILTNGTPHSEVTDLSPFISRTNKIAKSQTGELEWNWSNGVVKLTAPAVQGLTGFLTAAGSTRLPDVTIESANEYGTVLVVSLDGLPIATSGKLLLQVMSEEKPFGWTTDAATGVRTITSAG